MSEAYEKGLQKLGLTPDKVRDFDFYTQSFTVRSKWPDLRTDPAFAWRVLCAIATTRTIRQWRDLTMDAFMWKPDIATGLYEAVEAIGKGE